MSTMYEKVGRGGDGEGKKQEKDHDKWRKIGTMMTMEEAEKQDKEQKQKNQEYSYDDDGFSDTVSQGKILQCYQGGCGECVGLRPSN